MPRSKKTQARHVLADQILRLGVVMHPCSRCSSSGGSCLVAQGSLKCSSCTRSGVGCDVLEMPSGAQFDRIGREKRRLQAELDSEREALLKSLAKTARLEKQKASLERREADLLRRGVETVEELERLEESERLERE